LARLRLILDAAGAFPGSVAPFPDRSSRILGAAAAAVLSLPVADFDPGDPAARQLVVAYDLNNTDPDAVAALRWRVPGQILFERATCWTDPPRVAADVSGLLAQAVVAPWAGKPRALEDGTIGLGPADDRRVETIAAEIARTTPEQDQGDGGTPPDPDENLRRFVDAVAGAGGRESDGCWLSGLREEVDLAVRLRYLLGGPLGQIPCLFVFDDFEQGNLEKRWRASPGAQVAGRRGAFGRRCSP
jgi:hypothetical protein